jgi:hypothetical protein
LLAEEGLLLDEHEESLDEDGIVVDDEDKGTTATKE